jgi:hypothetical protein
VLDPIPTATPGSARHRLSPRLALRVVLGYPLFRCFRRLSGPDHLPERTDFNSVERPRSHREHHLCKTARQTVHRGAPRRGSYRCRRRTSTDDRDPQHWRDSQQLEHVLGKYIISDKPMTEEQWAKERATMIDVTLEADKT